MDEDDEAVDLDDMSEWDDGQHDEECRCLACVAEQVAWKEQGR